MLEIDTKQRADVIRAAQNFKVKWLEEGKRLVVIDPSRTVDGEPREVATFDFQEARYLTTFMMLLVAPSLTAAGLDPEKIFGRNSADTEGAA